MAKTEYSKLPWVLRDFEGIKGLNIISFGIDKTIASIIHPDYNQDELKANAEFIVRAVNNHDKLLGTLKMLIEALRAPSGLPPWLGLESEYDMAKEAIKQAEES